MTDSEIIRDYLMRNRERDILTGHTHIGPHRADWGFQVIQDERSNVENSDSPSFMGSERGYLDDTPPSLLLRHNSPHKSGGLETYKGRNEATESTPAESYLSRGEMKMILLGLKMIEREFIARTLDLPVILLIDDIFAELDERNSEIFLDSLTTHQVILTSQKPLPHHEKHHDFICINLEYS